MKLLLDENLSRRLVPFLQHDYPDSSQVVLEGLESATDMTVWEHAKSQQFVIVTMDADFEEMSMVLGQPPKIVWLKTRNPSRTTTLKTLLDCRTEIEDVLIRQNHACIEIS
ncbi:MAG: DUF5615 family PIN-like protein [Cytophagales bacterium]|nr:DUF5615 family PIN-like protein [Cytophagales bacterium]